MKGQTIWIIFILLLIFSLIFGWAIYSQLTKGIGLERKKIKTIERYYYESLLFLKYSILFSAYSSSYKLASHGFGYKEERNYWFLNGEFYPPEYNTIKYSLENEIEKKTLSFFENYRSKVSSVYKVNLSQFTCNLNLLHADILQGKYDENFKVVCAGILSLNYKNVLLKKRIFIEVDVKNIRIWYLYKIFYKFFIENSKKFNECLCNCLAYEEAFNTCSKKCYNSFFNTLKSKFDNFISCNYTEFCFKFNRTKPKVKCSFCTYWKEGCELPFPYSYLFYEEEKTLETGKNKNIFCSSCPEHKVSFEYFIFCIDKKYVIPIKNSLKYLKSSLKIYFSKRHSYLKHPCCGCTKKTCCKIKVKVG